MRLQQTFVLKCLLLFLLHFTVSGAKRKLPNPKAVELAECSESDATASYAFDPSQFEVYGPGIEDPVRVVLPTRYFYIHLTHAGNGSRVEPGYWRVSGCSDYIRMKIHGKSVGERRFPDCRAAHDVVDRRDGSFIVRYRPLTNCYPISIELTTSDGNVIGESPYTFEPVDEAELNDKDDDDDDSKNTENHNKPRQRPILRDGCNCPVPSRKRWYKWLGCPAYFDKIESDVGQWKSGSLNFSLALDEAFRRWGSHPGAHSYCHYAILDNNLYRKCYGHHVGFHTFSDAILLSLLRKVRLPDIQFLLNLGDWPLEQPRWRLSTKIPMFSWCGSDETADIVLPTYEMMEATLEAMGRTAMDTHSIQGMAGASPPWAAKRNRAFWRGRDSREERLLAVKLARANPDLLEADITRFFFFRDKIPVYGPEVDSLPFSQFFNYRYQLNIDGTVAAYRLAYLLHGDALVLKQDSPYYEHFYQGIRPWEHYVPVKRDLSDLLDQIKWAQNVANGDKVQKIIANAQSFVRDALEPTQLFCYYAKAFERYASILDDASISALPKVIEDMEMEPVLHEDNHRSDASCKCWLGEDDSKAGSRAAKTEL